MSQKVMQYQAVMQLAQGAPQIYDLPYLHRQMIETLGVKNASKLVPIVDDMKPVDPVSENMAILNGKPVKAFIIQDHDAHLAVHTSFLQDPKIAASMGQNPQGQALIAAAQAHIMEHTAFQYRANIEKMLGAQLPPPADDSKDEDAPQLPPEVEAQIAQLAAQAASKLLQKDQAEAQAQQAQQQQQDPLIQMQQQELQIKQSDVQRKAQKDQTDAQLKAQKQQQDMQIKEAELQLRAQENQIRTAVELQKHTDTHTSQMQLEGNRLGADIAHKRAVLARPQPVKEPK
jgi:hypothetical protein